MCDMEPPPSTEEPEGRREDRPGRLPHDDADPRRRPGGGPPLLPPAHRRGEALRLPGRRGSHQLLQPLLRQAGQGGIPPHLHDQGGIPAHLHDQGGIPAHLRDQGGIPAHLRDQGGIPAHIGLGDGARGGRGPLPVSATRGGRGPLPVSATTRGRGSLSGAAGLQRRERRLSRPWVCLWVCASVPVGRCLCASVPLCRCVPACLNACLIAGHGTEVAESGHTTATANIPQLRPLDGEDNSQPSVASGMYAPRLYAVAVL